MKDTINKAGCINIYQVSTGRDLWLPWDPTNSLLSLQNWWASSQPSCELDLQLHLPKQSGHNFQPAATGFAGNEKRTDVSSYPWGRWAGVLKLNRQTNMGESRYRCSLVTTARAIIFLVNLLAKLKLQIEDGGSCWSGFQSPNWKSLYLRKETKNISPCQQQRFYWSISCCWSWQQVESLDGESLDGDRGRSSCQRSPDSQPHLALGVDCKSCHEIQLTFNERVFSVYIASVTAKPCWLVGSCWSSAITVINVINCSYKKQFHSDC